MSAAADVIVVGAGHNGLTSACYLAQAGLRVEVVEAAPAIGGMTASQPLIPEAPDHLINLCALDLAMMTLVESVADELGLAQHGFRTIVTDPSYVAIDAEGASVAFWRDPRRTAEEIRRLDARDAEAYLDLVRLGEAAIDIGLPLVISDPMRPDPRGGLKSIGRSARHWRQLGELAELATSSAYEVVDQRFRHPTVRGLLALIVAAMGPVDGAGTGAVLAYWAWTHRFGVGRIAGGTQAFPDSLARCLEASGGTIRTNAPVEELVVSGGRVTGVRLAGGEEVTARRAVVCACDPHQTLNSLLPKGVLNPADASRAANIPTLNNGALCLKFDLALSGRVKMTRAEAWRGDGVDLREPFLYQGTIEQQLEAHERAGRGLLPDFIPYMATVPTAPDPGQAPDGQDTVYVYAFPIPHRPEQPWEEYAPAAVDIVLEDLTTHYEGILDLEIGRFVEPWPVLAERTRITNGHWGHVDVTPFRFGPRRPAPHFGGHKTPVPGLFLTGAGTHPGPGMSGIPGKLAARKVLRSI